MKYIPLFNGNNIYAKAPHCRLYVDFLSCWNLNLCCLIKNNNERPAILRICSTKVCFVNSSRKVVFSFRGNQGSSWLTCCEYSYVYMQLPLWPALHFDISLLTYRTRSIEVKSNAQQPTKNSLFNITMSWTVEDAEYYKSLLSFH